MNQRGLLIICLVIFCTNWTVRAQDLVELYKNKYPGHHEVALSNKHTYHIKLEKNKLKILQDNRFESLILTEIGRKNISESFSFSELVPVKSFDGYTIANVNGKERKIPLKTFSDKSSRESFVFYDDVKERKITFSNIDIGSRKIYSYQSEFLDPFLLHRHIFADYKPIEQSTFEIISDKNVEIGYKIFNDPTNKISFEKNERKGQIIYTWSMADITPFKVENNHPGILHSAPHIVVYIKGYKTEHTTNKVLGDINLLYNYYFDFVKNLNLTTDPNLDALANEITKNISKPDEKLKAIYQWVQQNIKYVAFENAYEGFVPREAKTVYERKFGDCKDMSSLITALAKSARIENVNLAWVGTRRIPYGYAELATPAVDDHMIVVYEKEGKPYFLDATDRELPFGLPSIFIQGKEALVQKGNDFSVVKIPVVSPKINLQKEVVQLHLEDTKCNGTGTAQYNGLLRGYVQNEIGDAKNKNRHDKIRGLLLKGNNKFVLKNFEESLPSDKSLPYEINYTFELDNYLVANGNQLFLNPILDKSLERVQIEKGRESLFVFEFLIHQEFEYQWHLPQNATVTHIPTPFKLDNDLIAAHIDYTQKNGIVYVNFKLYVKNLSIQPSEFDLWNASIKMLRSAFAENIVLKY